jgi:hypothetical protein
VSAAVASTDCSPPPLTTVYYGAAVIPIEEADASESHEAADVPTEPILERGD